MIKYCIFDDLARELENFIIDKYGGQQFHVYKGDWKGRFKAVAGSMGYKMERNVGNYWQMNIINALKDLKSISKVSSSINIFTSSSSN